VRSHLGPDDNVLCAAQLRSASLGERARLAANHGFTALSFFLEDYDVARDSGLSDADIRSLLSDHGLAVAELDPLMTWVPDSPRLDGASAEGAGFFRYDEQDFYRVADAVGARSINAVCAAPNAPGPERLAEALGKLCERAASHDLLVHLEFMPWTPIANATKALEIVELVDQPNCGIMLDTWHHFRSGLPDEALRAIPGDRLMAVQLNDASAEPSGDIIDETLHRRLLMGDGAIDLPGVLRILREIGSRAPLGVEVFCDDLAAKGPEEEARQLGAALRALRSKSQV